MMSLRFVGLALLFLFSVSLVLGSPLWEERDLRALEKRRLLNELEVEEDLEEERKELEDEEEIYSEVEQLVANARKRQIRQTPVPGVIRLKMTPAPNAPQPLFRLDHTPPIGVVHLKQTPAPPFNINGPLRQTPKVLRLTPAPPNAHPGYPVEGQWNWQDFMEKREMAMREMEEMERMRRMEMEVEY